ncbi:MAG TPA: hypothetical protein VMW68_00345 [Methyloceanibacter sp.]|nr:hypothetical protein [Methyloceanibacter sp.]
MTDRPNLCIQIGLHKTGTTTLNHEFYPKHPDIHHLGKPYDHDDPVRLLMEEINLTPEAEFDLEDCKRRFAQAVLPHLKGNKLVTINESSLAGGVGVERSVVARRLRAVCGSCKILVVLRRQDELLRSYYFQAVGTQKSRLAFEDWLSEGWVFARPAAFSLIDYYHLVAPYAAAFGRERVGVFLFEDLVANPDSFARELSSFMGIDAGASARLMAAKPRNPRMSRLHVFVRKWPGLLRLAQWIREGGPRPAVAALRWLAGRSGRAEAEMTPELARRLVDFIGRSNRRLAQEFGLPLDRHSYPLPAMGSEP